MRSVWIVVDVTCPKRLFELSTFRTGSGVLRCHSLRPCLVANVKFMIIPSAPLSISAQALISEPVCCPIKETRRVIEGLLILRIVPLGTGFESTVSNRTRFWMHNWGT